MEPVSAGLEKVVASSLQHAPAGEAAILAWPLACGSVVAGRTRALDFTRGVLRVAVADAGWRAELQSLAPRYVAMINRYVGNPHPCRKERGKNGAPSVQKIEFVVGKTDGH